MFIFMAILCDAMSITFFLFFLTNKFTIPIRYFITFPGKLELFELLRKEHIKIIVLHGEAGVGKTWKARKLRNLARHKNLVYIVLWVYLSRRYDKDALVDSIAQQLFLLPTPGEFEFDGAEKEDFSKQIQSTLSRKNVLLVLDDEGNMRNEKGVMSLLCSELKLSNHNYKLIITTKFLGDFQSADSDRLYVLLVDRSESVEAKLLLRNRTRTDRTFLGIETFAQGIPSSFILMVKAFKYFWKKGTAVSLFQGKAIGTDTLTQSKGLSVGQTLVSSGELFELGFFSPGNSSKHYIGIWYRNIYSQKVVWVANRENPISASDTASSLTIGRDGNLKLLDRMKNIVWSTNVSTQLNKTIAVLSEKGNLILKDYVSNSTSWESFSHPGDTFLAGMTTASGEKNYLSSWKTEDDPSPGIFLNGVTSETPPQNVVWKSSKLYWRSGPWDGSKFIGTHNTGVGFSNGFTVVEGSYVIYNPPSSSHIAVVYLAPDGNLERSHWDLVTQNGSAIWQGRVTWRAIEVPCDVYGSCGNHGVCDRNGTRSCECLKGFIPKSMEEWVKGNWTSGCVRRTELHCATNASVLATSKGKDDVFWKASLMKLPDKFIYIYNLNSSGCRERCLRNCSCEAYAYPDGIGCMVWNGHLIDTQKFSSGGADLFLRLAYSELGEKRRHTEIIISLTVIISFLLLGLFLFGLCKWQAYQRGNIGNKLLLGPEEESPELPLLDFNMLAVATNNFSETNKLGFGGFGPVYKGRLEDGKDIAVKRLSSYSGQGVEEFKNEILLISKLQHRNLVRLLGYCIKGDEKLLIYEYLKNKSLDTYLFNKQSAEQLNWAKRLNIIHGIARGLLYLHRDSFVRIIHRDLKASNILLDDNLNPKISDFGLARAFQITQELANTCRVVGTFGYISPEYAIRGIFSEKSDVYSFGVLLLEIISGMRITSSYNEGKYNLLCYAWHLWKEGNPLELMDQAISFSCPDTDFIQCMHIGLLCVQDHAIDRPTMSTIVLMLTSEMDLPQPKQPIFYESMEGVDLHSQSTSKFYMNYTTESVPEGSLFEAHSIKSNI